MGKLHTIVEFTKPFRRSPLHHHTTWEICYHTGGHGVATIEGRKQHRVHFHPGTIICYPPRLPHGLRSEKGCTMFCILTDAFEPAGTPVPVFVDSPDRAIGRTVELLHEEFCARQSDWDVATQQLLDRLLLLLSRRQHSAVHLHVTQLKQNIRERMFTVGFNAGDAMADLPISPHRLRQLFHETTGQTPTQYLIDLRMAAAKRLLRSGQFNVKEVAARVGLSDPYYFSRLFHKTTGHRPSVYVKTTAPTPAIDYIKD